MKAALSKEQREFISALKCFVNEDKYIPETEPDWSIIESYSADHQVGPVLYYVTHRPEFKKTYLAQLHRVANYRVNTEIFIKAMGDLEYLFVKGNEIARLYPVPQLRTMGDIDVMIHKADLQQINSSLTAAGFSFIAYEKGESQYTRNGVMFELHDTMIHEAEGKEHLIEYYSRVWDYANDGVIDMSFHLLYLLEHLRQHFVRCGVGFRQFMDIAIVCRKCDINWSWMDENLKTTGLYDFSRIVLSLIREWFGVSTPLGTIDLENPFFTEATCRIFENGVFGFNNSDNREHAVSVRMYYEKIDYQAAKKKHIISMLFPAYQDMCKRPYCRYVRKSKILLPAAWLHRLIYCALSKEHKEHFRAELSETESRNRILMFKEWGL